MMQASNNITLIGNIGQKPEITKMPNGQFVTNFSIATNYSYRNKAGERVKKTDWHRVTAYGRQAETLAEYTDKGSKIVIIGSLGYQKWTDKFDQPRTTPEIVVNSFNFLSNAGDNRQENRRG